MIIGLDLDWTGSDYKSLQNLGPGPDLDWLMEKKWGILLRKGCIFPIFLNFIWTWAFHLKNILDCGWTWTEFKKFRTGFGLQNLTVCSSLLAGRDEHWTGLGLDWIRTIGNFVKFVLYPACKYVQNLGTRPDWD